MTHFKKKKKSKSKFRNCFFDLKWKNEFQKNIFHFSHLIIELKKEKRKIFKIRFAFKSKNELYFRYTNLTFNFHLFRKLKNNLVLYFMP